MEHDPCNYELSAPNGCVANLCALCRELIALEPGVYTAAQIEQRIAAHHAVCEKRPIAVGDYVRWEYGLKGHFASPANWSEGEVTGGDGRYLAKIRVERCGMGTRAGKVMSFGIGADCGSTIRRIPRPVGSVEQPIELDCYVEWRPDGSQSLAAGQVVKMDGDRAIVRIREVSQTWTAFEACPFSGHARSIPLAQLRRIAWPHEGQGPVDQPRGGQHEPAPVADPPAPALVDGMTREDCLRCYVAYMRGDKHGDRVTLTGWLSAAQLTAAREEWSAALRARVAASDAADKAMRPSVRVEVQDVD